MMQNDTPRMPPGWETYAGALIRIASADERSLAWIAPDYGANCVAFMVRAHGEWVPVLHNDGPQSLAGRPSRYGCAVLFPFPGHMLDFQYQWQGETFTIPRRGSTAPNFAHGFAHTHGWRIVETARDRMTATFTTPDDLTPEERAGYPFSIRLTEAVALVGNTLHIALHAMNEGHQSAPVGIALHPYFAVAALGGERAGVRVRIPGRREHLLTPPIPTGEKHPVTTPTVIAPPAGETALIARTELDRDARALLSGPLGNHTIEFAFVAGVRDVVYFIPPDQPSLSLEPHSCAPSAASQPPGDPDGLVPLAPGARLDMTVAITLNSALITEARHPVGE
ncbi:MAG: aldose epimerase family protein [Thermomicrobiales bacterium]